MEALALPLIGFALQHVPDLIGPLLGPQAKQIAEKVTNAAGAIFGTADPAVIAQQDAAKLEAFKAALSALVASDQAQATVNTAEAGSSSIFVAGWRPFVGWVCGAGLTYCFVAFPFLTWLSLNMKWTAPPQLESGTLLTLLTGMLGLATVRSYDKLKGIDTKSIVLGKG